MKKLGLLLLIVVMGSCASIYKPIDPRNFNYDETNKESEITYDYKSSVLSMTGNKRYAKKGFKYGIDMIAVKIQNNTDNIISVKNSVDFFAGGREVVPMDSYEVVDVLRQKNSGFYLFYALLFLNIDTPSTQANIPIGAAIGLGNIIAASSSNSSFKKNFARENIMNKSIQPGETIYGLVAFRGLGSGKLDMKLRQK